MKFVSRLDSTTHEETLFEICRDIEWGAEVEDSIINDKISYLYIILLKEVLLLIIKALLERSLAFKNSESIYELNFIRHKIYYRNFDKDSIERELKKISYNLKKQEYKYA